MDTQISASLHLSHKSSLDFNSLFCHLNTLLLLPDPFSSQNIPTKFKNQNNNSLDFSSSSSSLSLEIQQNPIKPISQNWVESTLPFPNHPSSENAPTKFKNQKNHSKNSLFFSSTSISIDFQQNPTKPTSQKWLKLPFPNHPSSQNAPNKLKNPNNSSSSSSSNGGSSSLFSSTSLSIEIQQNPPNPTKPTSQNCSKPSLSTQTSLKMQSQTLMKTLSVLERSLIGAFAGGIAGAFTYVCLHPLDTIKTKLQTKGASQLYTSSFDAIAKTFQAKGILGFYSGVSAVIVGSTASSSVYFGTCEFGKSILSKLPHFPSILIPPTAGAMGNIVSSAIMVPKELITQRMQAGAAGRSWQVLLRILERDGVLGLYAGYSATLLRNLPTGVLSYSSFEYLKSAVLIRTGNDHLEPLQSVCCGALAGAISASVTTPLDVVKTRLMTQVTGEAKSKIAVSVYGGVSATVRQILKEEGWVGLTRGVGPRVLHSACFAALGYFAFETARLMLLHQYVSRRKDEMEPVSAGL